MCGGKKKTPLHRSRIAEEGAREERSEKRKVGVPTTPSLLTLFFLFVVYLSLLVVAISFEQRHSSAGKTEEEIRY